MLLDYVMIGGFGVAGLRNDRRIWCCWIEFCCMCLSFQASFKLLGSLSLWGGGGGGGDIREEEAGVSKIFYIFGSLSEIQRMRQPHP